MTLFCQYSDLFGKPGEGSHSVRVGNVAIIDLALTVAAAWGIAYWSGKSFWLVFGLLMIAAVVMHRLFCVRTTVDKLLFK